MVTLYSLTDVQQRYGQRPVLAISNLVIEQGEIFGIVGPSGAGKSSLLRLLALLERPVRGSVAVYLNGRPATCETASIAERRQVVMVFQRPLLLSRQVRANVAYGLHLRGERNNRDRVDDVLRRVDLLRLANAPCYTLSGGEMQRVAIARALVLEPRVLLLDEPTANLDPYNVALIEDLIHDQHVQHHTTIVLVTHNIFQARRLATRVALVLDGELIEVAPADDFFNTPADPRTAAFLSGDFVY